MGIVNVNNERKWTGRWINARGSGYPRDDMSPAPYLRKTFFCDENPKSAVIYLCGLGWHELYINGSKADDRVLAPTVTQYDKHVSFIEYNVGHLLQKGKNAVTVLLGNGWYNCQTHVSWEFEKAPWRDFPKLLCDIFVDGKLAACSDTSWKVGESPITFNALRNGQFYDARKEIPGVFESVFDDSAWKNARLCNPPGGRIVPEVIQPCKVMQSYPAVEKRFVTCWENTYDFGADLTGWCRIRVKGEAGATVEIKYAEQVEPFSGNINTQEIDRCIKSGRFQTDQYILKGDPDGEEYEPSFTYHGFRYAQIWIVGKAELVDIEAKFIHTAFDVIGSFESSDATLNKLQANTLQSFKSNFTGIPTDCPHREKNGWTGDAAIAAETGIWNFDMQAGYAHFIQILTDTQRANGQLPGIAPTGGWGFNWGSGPAWDQVLFEYPWQVYLFTGNTDLIKCYYDNFKLYLEYCENCSENNLVNCGLGDWCHWNRFAITPVEVTSSAYYYRDVVRTAFFADLLGKKSDADDYKKLAEKIRQSFVQKFANSDGSFADKSLTATAAALYFEFITGEQAKKSADYLVNQVREQQHKANFGILGAKYIPRVLADYGYADDAFEIITQKEFPGWGWQVAQGAQSLWENWNGKDSRNHIMFGDISAWMYQYLGGIKPLPGTPGFSKFEIHPCFVKKLDYAKATHKTQQGEIRCVWKRQGDSIQCRFDIPQGSCADIILPGESISNAQGSIESTVSAI